MWYFTWTPAIGIIDAVRINANSHGQGARRSNAGKHRS
jgi:hypothetical protein